MTTTLLLHDRSPATTESPTEVLRRLSRRAREPSFWYVQAMVVAVTVLHGGLEASGVLDDHSGPVSSLAHLPVVLYLLPVVYAGLRYGFEGGLLTGASVTLLSSPNLFLWHGDDYDWLGELAFVIFVGLVGAIIALPVEREQRQRARAELARRRATEVSRRLSLVNDVISTLVESPDVDALDRVLRRLVETLALDAAVVVTWRTDGSGPVIEGSHTRTAGAGVHDLAEHLRAMPPPTSRVQLDLDPPAQLVPFQAGQQRCGAIAVQAPQPLPLAELRLLEAIAGQVGVALDNAELHAVERQAVQAYLQGVTQAQEEERRRIARDLHDVATHELLLARRDLEDLTAGGPAVAVARAHDRLTQVITHLRQFGRTLRPSVLEPLGLAPALEWLASQVDGRNDSLDVIVRIEGQPRRLAPDVELALYRIAEEALRNAERHAAAEHASLTVEFGPDEVVLEVSDDGVGFDPPASPAAYLESAGLGLLGMRERASLADADLTLTSAPGHGTTVAVRLVEDA